MIWQNILQVKDTTNFAAHWTSLITQEARLGQTRNYVELLAKCSRSSTIAQAENIIMRYSDVHFKKSTALESLNRSSRKESNKKLESGHLIIQDFPQKVK